MIVGVRYTERCQTEARRFAPLRVLQDILSGQCSRGLVSQREGILQELNNLGFGLQVLRTVSVLNAVWQFIAGERRPQKIIGGGDVPDLHGKRAHTFVVAARNLPALGGEVE